MTAYLDYAARGNVAWWRYVLGVLCALLLAAVAPAALVLVLVLARLWPADLMTLVQDPAHPVAFFLFTGAIFLALLLAFVVAARWVQHKRFGDVTGAWSWRNFGRGFGIWSVALVVATALDVAIAPHGFRLSVSPQTPALVLAALVGLGVQTFAEEFVFRGYATQGLLLATGRPAVAAVLSGLLFGAMHIPNGAPQAVSATIFGVLLSLIAIRMGGIAFTYGLHLANNLFSAVVVASTGDAFHGAPALFSQSTPQLMWWDAAVGAAALTVVTALVFRRYPADQGRG